MITAFLSAAVAWCMFFGRLPSEVLITLCLGLGALLLFLGHHDTRFLTIDVLAQISRLNKINASLKFWTALALMVICVSARGPAVGLFLAAAAFILTVFAGGLNPRYYLRLLALPVSFLMIGGLALLFEVTPERTGVIGVNVFGVWLCVTTEAQVRAALVMGRSLGAFSCLHLLNLTTPMPELIGVLRRSRCPSVLIDLMYLIYRYIFILLSMFHAMRDAAASRLGFADYRASIRSTGYLYSNLLSRSYRQARVNIDAMESRCYDNQIRFLENVSKITGAQAAAAIGLTIFTLGLSFLLN